MWLVVFIVPLASGISLSDCSKKNSCYGSPVNCQPGIDCHVLLRFEDDGTLDVHLQNFTAPDGYVALAYNSNQNAPTEYLICIPHERKRLRGISSQGEIITITEQNMAQYVAQMDTNTFICSFVGKEIPSNFRMQSNFVVSEGLFANESNIPTTYKLEPISTDSVFFHPIAATIGRQDEALSEDEEKLATDLLGKVQRLSDHDSESTDMEAILNEKNRFTIEEFEEKLFSAMSNRRRPIKKFEREEEDQDDDEYSEVEEKESHPKKRREHKKGRHTRVLSDEQEEDYDQYEDDMPSKKRKRPFNSEELENGEDVDFGKKSNKNSKRGRSMDKDRDDDDAYNSSDDDYDNSSAKFKHFRNAIIILVFCIHF